MLSEVVTCNCVRNPGGHAESNPRPSEEGVSFYHVLRPLDLMHTWQQIHILSNIHPHERTGSMELSAQRTRQYGLLVMQSLRHNQDNVYSQDDWLSVWTWRSARCMPLETGTQ